MNVRFFTLTHFQLNYVKYVGHQNLNESNVCNCRAALWQCNIFNSQHCIHWPFFYDVCKNLKCTANILVRFFTSTENHKIFFSDQTFNQFFRSFGLVLFNTSQPHWSHWPISVPLLYLIWKTVNETSLTGFHMK